jgi:hypothetical protein
MKLLALAAAFPFALAIIGACSSDESSPPCALVTGKGDPFCEALATYDGRCGHCSDCTGKNLERCTTKGAAISAAHRAALIACKDEMPCSNTPSQTRCVRREMKKIVPSPTQERAKSAYCNACGATNAEACADFFRIDETALSDGIGYSVLLAGDATVERAIGLCSAKCTPLDYAVCVALVSCGDEGGDSCVDSGFCAVR